MRPILEDPQTDQWSGPDEVLTALYKWAKTYDPAEQSYALRSKDWRYIRYSNGQEELYHTAVDPYEWDNLADDPQYKSRLQFYRQRLQQRLPTPGSSTPADRVTPAAKQQSDAEAWKDRYFARHPKADTNGDGTLSWPELRAYREKYDPPPKKDK